MPIALYIQSIELIEEQMSVASRIQRLRNGDQAPVVLHI